MNAVIHRLYDQARVAAQGELPTWPLCGMPFLIKDVLALVAGASTSSGMRLLKDLVAPLDMREAIVLQSLGFPIDTRCSGWFRPHSASLCRAVHLHRQRPDGT